MSTTDERVFKVIGDIINTDAEIKNGMLLRELGYDSLKNVELVVALEEEFNIRFDDSALSQSKFATTNSVVEFVKENLR